MMMMMIKSTHEEYQDHPWPQIIPRDSSKKIKQLELSFFSILDVETVLGADDEHTRGLDENPPKLHDEPDPLSNKSPYIRKTGKMTLKEARTLASKNKSILSWMSSIVMLDNQVANEMSKVDDINKKNYRFDLKEALDDTFSMMVEENEKFV